MPANRNEKECQTPKEKAQIPTGKPCPVYLHALYFHLGIYRKDIVRKDIVR
jgi:hypothetical protein